MRIISGKYKGRYITPSKHKFKARPTTDYAKESLFNVLHNHFNFEELNFLDLFAGTGSISYEFASRGCNNIISIENNYTHYKYIKDTINQIGFQQINLYKADAFKFILKTKEKFDIIFADPPFELDKAKTLPELIFNQNLLKKGGWFILEHDKKNDFKKHYAFFEKRVYGSVNFSFFKHTEP